MTFSLARSTVLLAATAISTPALAHAFDIRAGDATQTIPQFAAQADIQVLAPQSVLAGQPTRAVRGEMSPAAALARMIEGSQLRAEQSGSRTVVISRSLRQPVSLMVERTAPAQAAAASAAPATQPAEEAAGGDIVVTARRTEERLQDVPLAVTAVRGEALQAAGVTQVMDLRQAVVGLNVSSASGRTATPLYAIRGHRASDITVTQDPAVAIYVDDVIVTPLHGGNLGLFDLANVQVLKGPQGTLFGRNTTGGAVLFTTAKPTGRLEGYVRLGYGNYATKTAQAVLNVPVAEWLRVRGGIDYTKSNGFGRVIAAPAAANPTNLPQPGIGAKVRDRDELSLRFTASMTPVDGLENTTTVFYSRAFSGGPGFKMFDPVNPAGLAKATYGAALDAAYARQQTMGDYDVESTINPVSRVRIFGVSDTLTAQLGDNLTFKSVFGYRRTRYIETNDSDGSILPIIEATNITNIDQFSFEPQLQGKAFDNRLTYILGAYYFDQKGRDFGDGSQTFGAASSIGGNLHNSSFSGFGQATYALGDATNLTGGFRYTVDKRAFDLENYAGSSAAPGACNLFDASGARLPITGCVLPVSTSFSSPSWLVSVDHKIGPDVMVYLSHRAGYRSGGVCAAGVQCRHLAVVPAGEGQGYRTGRQVDHAVRRRLGADGEPGGLLPVVFRRAAFAAADRGAGREGAAGGAYRQRREGEDLWRRAGDGTAQGADVQPLVQLCLCPSEV